MIAEIIGPHLCIMWEVCCAAAIMLLDLGFFHAKILNTGHSKAFPLHTKQRYKYSLWQKVLKLTRLPIYQVCMLKQCKLSCLNIMKIN